VQLVPDLNTLRKSGPFSEDVFCLFRSIPKAVLGYNGLNLTEPLLFSFYVKDSPLAVRTYSEEILSCP
jgi:hypothetical protein